MCLWFDCDCPILILCCNFVMIYVISSIHALLRVCSLQPCMLKYNQDSYPVVHLPIHSSICLLVSLSIHPSIHSLMYVSSRPFVMFSWFYYCSALVQTNTDLLWQPVLWSKGNSHVTTYLHLKRIWCMSILCLIYEYATDFLDTMHVHHNYGTTQTRWCEVRTRKITESMSTLSNT